MSKAYYFVSYSSRELHVKILLDALSLVLGTHFDQHLTPPALESAQSQYQSILKEINGASFGVVILDGLRPNVVFEYGIMVAKRKPVLLFQEESAEVDIPGFFQGVSDVKKTSIVIDSQFSDVKDQFCAKWFKFDPKATRRVVVEEYAKKAGKIKSFVEIKKTGLLFD